MRDKVAFIAAVNENEALIYKVASFYTDSKDDRDDLVQEIIYQLWRSFNTFNNRSGISTWIYRVALNTAIYFLKKSKRKIRVEPIGINILNYPDTVNHEIEEQLKIMHQHIKLLNLLEKGIMMLYLEGKSYEEISILIGITSTNVGTKINRIKEKLKQQIFKNR